MNRRDFISGLTAAYTLGKNMSAASTMRILWKHILAVHEPMRGSVVYYTPMQPGMYRVYSDEFDSTWCLWEQVLKFQASMAR